MLNPSFFRPETVHNSQDRSSSAILLTVAALSLSFSKGYTQLSFPICMYFCLSSNHLLYHSTKEMMITYPLFQHHFTSIFSTSWAQGTFTKHIQKSTKYMQKSVLIEWVLKTHFFHTCCNKWFQLLTNSPNRYFTYHRLCIFILK